MSRYDPKTPNKINAVSILIFLAVVGGLYAGWWYVPTWWAVRSLHGPMKEVGNSAFRVWDDRQLKADLMAKTKDSRLDLKDQDFTIKRLRHTAADMAGWDRKANTELARKRGKALRITFDKTVQMKWPLTSKVTPRRFYREVEVELKANKW